MSDADFLYRDDPKYKLTTNGWVDTSMNYRHFAFMSRQYRDNLGKALRALRLAITGRTPYRTYWIGLGMRLTQGLNAFFGRSRGRTTSAYCGYQLWGRKPAKLRYYGIVMIIDAGALWVFGDVDHCRGAAESEGYL